MPLAAQAQIALFSFNGATETPVGPIFNFGPIATGDSKDIAFRVRNQGVAPVDLTTVGAFGAGFTTPNLPTLPYHLAPASLLAFTVHFAAAGAGSYSANLQVNGLGSILLATSVPAASLAVLPACSGVNPVDFGRVQRGLTAQCTFTLSNPNAATITVNSLAISPGVFQGPLGVRAPIQLLAGERVTFTVNFSPTDSIPYSATLTADSKTVQLTGIGFDPPLPKPTLTFDSNGIASAQQRTLSMTLPVPSPVAASGLVTLSFTPNTQAGVTDDPAIVFVATGSRKVGFSVKAGDTAVLLGGNPRATFQTGTTAGTIRFAVDAGTIGIAGDPTTSISITPAPISIETATGVRRTRDLDVSITGFDNTYTAGTMVFTFIDTSGRTIDPGPIGTDFTANFKTFFSAAQAGSAFLLRVTFPVTGDATQVAGVDVQMTNAAGVAHSQRVVFP